MNSEMNTNNVELATQKPKNKKIKQARTKICDEFEFVIEEDQDPSLFVKQIV